MSHIFRIHKTGNVRLKDWEKSAKIDKVAIQTIPDTIKHGVTSKIGSSIPSPFARMYLFDAAFQIIANDDPAGSSMYHQLVSDCLDLYQFLFMYADKGNITFQKWDKGQRIKSLKKSSFEAHQNLANTLELFFNSTKFQKVQYKGKLVGGTSPITGLYVSPNWQRIMMENGWQFKMSNNDILFDDEPCPIFQRDEDFMLYMYKFVYAYSEELGAQSDSFFNYFINTRKKYATVDRILADKKLDVGYSKDAFKASYDPIPIDPTDDQKVEHLVSSAYPILKPKADDIIAVVQKSDFLMAPTQNYYKNRLDEQGLKTNDEVPLVLLRGNHQLNYIDKPWEPTLPVPDFPDFPLHKRKLPGLAYKYPFLTTGDFMESTLIEMPYNLDKKNFYTGFGGHFKYLLPIKKLYFNYFSIEDLTKQLEITQTNSQVTVVLNIPLRHGRTFPFRKIYNLNDPNQVIKQKRLIGFNLGVFPFYQITDRPSANLYNIALVNNVQDLAINFYDVKKIVNNKPVESTSKVRTPKSKIDLGSTYYTIQGATFDCIEVEIGAVVKTTGLIIPLFEKVDIERTTKEFNFAIDFGTSNTHIAYNVSSDRENIKGFDINEGDRQMRLLSEIDGGGGDMQQKIRKGAGQLVTAIDVLNREFVAGFINKDNPFHFPTRTTICEHETYVAGKPELFGNMNIGLFLERDPQATDDNKYFTNIKWEIEGNLAGAPKERVQIFFRQILWLIKNKIILNKGGFKANIVWMVPLSMRKRLMGIFETIWKEEIKYVFGEEHQITLIKKFESIVPYYALKSFRRAEDVINIDIGGGTTDILFFCKKPRASEYFSTSFRFAGNDIWGEGLNEFPTMDNGFFLMMDQKLNAEDSNFDNSTNIRPVFENFKKSGSLDSADACSLFFKHDKLFKFSDHIQNHDGLRTILFIHIAAIIYHVSKIIEAKDLALPLQISFTGKGSEYIKLLSQSSDHQTDIVYGLLSVFTGKQMPRRAKVSMAANPKELTAEGAINTRSFNDKEEIDRAVKNIVHMGIEKTDEFDPMGLFYPDDLGKLEQSAKAHFNEFLKAMKQREVAEIARDFDLKLRYNGESLLDLVEDFSDRSFSEMVAISQDMAEDDSLEETLFFWFLKDSLYQLSQELVA